MIIPVSGSKPRLRRFNNRSAALLVGHAAVFAAAYFCAFFIRNDFEFEAEWLQRYAATVGGVVAIKLVVFYVLGLCHVSWSRISLSDLTSLLWAATVSLLIFTALDTFLLSTGWVSGIPRIRRSIILLDWAGTIFILGGLRAVWRSIREEIRPLFAGVPARTILIVGADQAGEMIARGLNASSAKTYAVAGFLDEDPGLRHTRIAGLEVLGDVDDCGPVVRKRRIDEVIVQSGSLSGKRFRKLLADCNDAGAELKVLPGIDELLTTSRNPSHISLRPVEIKDLLRRDPVRLDDTAIRKLIAGRTVMVTGAGGSIGSEICRQVLRYAPAKLLLVERAENSLFLVEQEFARLQPRPNAIPLIADVTDAARIEQIMDEHRPDVIFHAAAHKHVPMMEWNPAEAIKNNVFGTRLLAQLADQYGVREFVAISTDKAVNPTSVMGCSKLLAERYVQALSETSETRFIVVRFGNVLASNGSVVPIFQDQIRRGGPITITHPAIERFFMTIPEASQLVLQSASMGAGGEIFVLDMGESVKIIDLARDLIALSGLESDDIEIVFTGLRPGEKLFEELYFDDEERVATAHVKVFCARHRPAEMRAVEGLLEHLHDLLDEPPEKVRAKLRELVPEFADEPVAEAGALPRGGSPSP